MSDTTNSPAVMSSVQAMSTTAFVGSIGVASHLDDFGTGYTNNYSSLVADLQYLGINLIRSGAVMDFDGGGGQYYADEVELAMAAGIKFDLVINDDALSPSYYTTIFDQLETADPGGIAAVENTNEVHPADLPSAAVFNASLALAIEPDPLLNGVQIYNYTILSYQPTAFSQEGDLDGSVTMGNVHVYSDNLPPNDFDSWFAPVNLGGTPGVNYAVTETGYETASGLQPDGQAEGGTQDVEANYVLDDVFDLIRNGASEVYIDELYDLGTDPSYNEDNFGLFTYDGVPKEAAVALHNLTTILADPGATAGTFIPGSLSYSITGLNSTLDAPALEQAWNFGILASVAQSLPVNGYSLLLQKSDGSFDLAVWQEPEIFDTSLDQELQVPTISSTITLAETVASIEVYDPLLGTTPIATYTDTDQITIGVSDHPIIVEIDPFPGENPAPTTSPPATPSVEQQQITPAPVASTPSPSPAAVVVGSGPDTITLVVSEDAFEGDAQFTVSVNGAQLGGVLTTTAQQNLGQRQLFILQGNFNSGTNAVAVTFLNDAYGGSPSADRNLYVLGASQNGVDSAGSELAFFGGYTQTMTVGTPVPGPTVVGSGPDTLALTVSEQEFNQDGQFTISVDGVQVGGTLTATAISALGDSQVFDVKGDFGPGSHTVSLDVINGTFIAGYPLGANALNVLSANIDGSAISNSALSMTTIPFGSFTFTEPGSPTAANTDPVIGSGADIMSISVSERAEDSGAQFTISVDGQQIGGVQTTSASSLAGQTETFDVLGNFGAGNHAVSIDYLNADDSLLMVTSASIDGNTVPDGAITLSNDGTLGFGFTAPDSNPATIGTGPDSLDLFMSERAEAAGAQFTVSVDGQQIGGVQTASADALAGQEQQLDVLGRFAPGSHAVSIDYLNADNSLLYVNTATIDGEAVNGSSFSLSNNGAAGFSFIAPIAPPPSTIGTGPDTLALELSEDYAGGNAQFTVAVDGQQVGSVQTAGAINGDGESQVLNVLGRFTGAHTVSVSLLGGSSASLYLSSASIDGAGISNSALALHGPGTETLTFSH